MGAVGADEQPVLPQRLDRQKVGRVGRRLAPTRRRASCPAPVPQALEVERCARGAASVPWRDPAADATLGIGRAGGERGAARAGTRPRRAASAARRSRPA